MKRVVAGLSLAIALVSTASAGWLGPNNPKARLAAPVTCVAEPAKLALHLERGTLIEEINLVSEPPHNTPMFEVDVLSGRYRGWRCWISGAGHPPLTIDKKK